MERLKPGDLAPSFTAHTFDGKTVNLDYFKGKKTWLCFYRYANCPLCHQHIFEITQNMEKMRLNNIQIVAVFESERVKFGKLQGRKFPRFPMISDPQGKLYELYGIPKSVAGQFHPVVMLKWFQAAMNGFFQGEIDGPFSRIPGHFLINEDLKIETVHYGVHAADHIDWNAVQKFVGGITKTKRSALA